MKLKDITALLKEELLLIKASLENQLDNKNILLGKILKYIVHSKGKQIRPVLVLLCAKAYGEPNENTYTAATLIELLHTASLVHDDVVDHSYKRRGRYSINALWRNKLAVLVGDFLLARGLILAVATKNFNLLGITASAIKRMSEGEIFQIEQSRKNIFDERAYLEIARNKTASLFAACCEAGASTTTDDKRELSKMRLLGLCIGMIFQIRDDVLDISSNRLNKPMNADFIDHKTTLPLIYALASVDQGHHIWKMVRSKKNRKRYLQEVYQFILDHQGLEKTERKIEKYKTRALRIISTLHPSPYTEALANLVAYAHTRSF